MGKLSKTYKKSGNRNGMYGKKHSEETKEKMRNKQIGKRPMLGKKHSEETKEKISISKLGKTILTIEKIKEKFPTFYKEEEMRYNTDKPGEKEIQVHCKNHDCENSKEKGGWFIPTASQFKSRKDHIEHDDGNGGCYLYCSQECKDECVLYNIKSDPHKEETEKLYTDSEYDVWRQTVLEQDNYECQKCGSKEDLHCHHIQPVKLDPMLALDPTNGIVLCQKCHYEIGHKTATECSTGNLANRVC